MKITLKTIDTNKALKDPKLIDRLRKLTLYPDSGMNCELDNLADISKQRKVKSKIILAYAGSKIVGWALLSREKSWFGFICGVYNKKVAKKSCLIELFVSEKYRRRGIGKAIMNRAKKQKSLVKNHPFAIAPSDYIAVSFFDYFEDKYIMLDHGEELYE